jgi:hypothetical protein
MSFALRPFARRLATRYAYHRASLSAEVGWGLGRNPKPRRMLLISDGKVMTSEQQYTPFARHAVALRRQLGLVTRPVSVETAMAMQTWELADYEIVGLKLSFQTGDQEAVRIAEHLRDGLRGTASRLVYFDGDDDLNIMWPSVLAACDLYVKKHAYADRADYGLARIGKSNLTDYVARHHGYSFADNEIPSTAQVPAGLTDKIIVGWNISLDDKIAELVQRTASLAAGERPVDVCARAVAPPEMWIFPFRDPVARELERLQDELDVHVPHDRVSQDDYYQEMLASKICVSPFGFGEICWRDFEAVLCGCLVVKPDMGHVETAPNLFQAGVTYAPVKWDFSDLADVCRHYAHDHEGRERIIRQASETLLESLSAEWFVDRVANLMERAGLQPR